MVQKIQVVHTGPFTNDPNHAPSRILPNHVSNNMIRTRMSRETSHMLLSLSRLPSTNNQLNNNNSLIIILNRPRTRFTHLRHVIRRRRQHSLRTIISRHYPRTANLTRRPRTPIMANRRHTLNNHRQSMMITQHVLAISSRQSNGASQGLHSTSRIFSVTQGRHQIR